MKNSAARISFAIEKGLAIGLALALGIGSDMANAQADHCTKDLVNIYSLFQCALERSASYSFSRQTLARTKAIESKKDSLYIPRLVATAGTEDNKYTAIDELVYGYNALKKTEYGAGFAGRYFDLGLNYEANLLKIGDVDLSGQILYQSGAQVKLSVNLLKDAGMYTSHFPFRGFWIDLERSKIDLDATRESIAAQSVQLYLRHWINQKREQFYEKLLATYQARQKTNEKLASIGRSSGLNLASIGDQVVETELKLTEQQLASHDSRAELCTFLRYTSQDCAVGRLEEPKFELSDSELSLFQKSAKQSLKFNYDYKRKRLEIEERMLKIDQGENELRPTLDLQLGGTFKGNLETTRQVAPGSEGRELSAMIVFSLPLDRSIAREQLALRQVERRFTERSVKEMEIQSQNAVLQLIDTYQLYHQSLGQARRRLELSQKRVELAKVAHTVGSVSLKDLIDFEASLQEVTLFVHETNAQLNQAGFSLLMRMNPMSFYRALGATAAPLGKPDETETSL